MERGRERGVGCKPALADLLALADFLVAAVFILPSMLGATQGYKLFSRKRGWRSPLGGRREGARGAEVRRRVEGGAASH